MEEFEDIRDLIEEVGLPPALLLLRSFRYRKSSGRSQECGRIRRSRSSFGGPRSAQEGRKCQVPSPRWLMTCRLDELVVDGYRRIGGGS